MLNNKYIRMGAIAVALAGVLSGTSSYTNLINTKVYAANGQIVDSSFKSIYSSKKQVSIYDSYDQYSKEINQSQTSEGIKVTIKKAVFDGRQILFTYEIESNKDLGDSFRLRNTNKRLDEKKREKYDSEIKVNNNNGTSSIEFLKIKRINGNRYAGAVGVLLDNDADTVDFEFVFDSIMKPEELRNSKNVIAKGKWDINVKLDALYNEQLDINKSSIKGNFKFTVDRIKRTPISFYIEGTETYDQGSLKSEDYSGNTELLVKDDLGNVYDEIDGEGYCDGSNVSKMMNRYGKINDKATKLIITPTMQVRNSELQPKPDQNGVVHLDENNTVDQDIVGENELDSIVIDLK